MYPDLYVSVPNAKVTKASKGGECGVRLKGGLSPGSIVCTLAATRINALNAKSPTSLFESSSSSISTYDFERVVHEFAPYAESLNSLPESSDRDSPTTCANSGTFLSSEAKLFHASIPFKLLSFFAP